MNRPLSIFHWNSNEAVRRALIVTLLWTWANIAVAASIATFTPLGGVAPTSGFGRGIKSIAGSVSGNGVTIAGRGSAGLNAVRWDGTTGPISLLPAGGDVFSTASGVSFDGSVIVGSNEPRAAAFRWTATDGISPIEDYSKQSDIIEATGVSGDGKVVVGSTSTLQGRQAYRWTAATGAVHIDDLPGGDVFSIAEATNYDGSVVVGQSDSDLNFEPFRWTSAGGTTPLRTLAGNAVSGCARDVTGDGKTVVGYAYSDTAHSQSFRWTESAGLIELTPPPGAWGSFASAITSDGATIIGSIQRTADADTAAYIWTASQGMRDLKSVLVDDYGLDLTGWTLSAGSDISSDGSVLIGSGINPQGEAEGWRVTLPIPEPQPFSLILSGVLTAITKRRRRK